MSLLLRPFSIVYGGVTGLRNRLYDRGWLRSYVSECPVVSVGNITTGGTGKTPMVDHLLKWTAVQGLKPGVVSRGYRGRFSGERRVMPQSEGIFFGDEPMQLARRHPTVPVYVGADRPKVLQALLEENKVDVVFADDAFQHRALGRDVDIVLIDALEDISRYRPLPEGRLREPLVGLSRAHFVVLTRVNLAGEEQMAKLYQFLKSDVGLNTEHVIEADYRFAGLRHWVSGRWVDPKHLSRPSLLVSGIGRPESLRRLLANVGLDWLDELSFRDHHAYKPQDAEKILRLLRDSEAMDVVTTEKDAIKLEVFPALRDRLLVVDLEVVLSIQAKAMYEKILALGYF